MEALTSLIFLRSLLGALSLIMFGLIVIYLRIGSYASNGVRQKDHNNSDRRSGHLRALESGSLLLRLPQDENVSRAGHQESSQAIEIQPSPNDTRSSQSVKHHQKAGMGYPKRTQQVRTQDKSRSMNYATFATLSRTYGQEHTVSFQTNNETRITPFFQLPAEIRELIYCEFVRHNSNIVMTFRAAISPLRIRKSDDCSELSPPLGSEAYQALLRKYDENTMKSSFIPYLNGLAQTCRLAYQESSHVLYRQNHFSFSNADMLNNFVYSSLSSHVQAIQEITVTDLLSGRGNLRHLCFRRLKLLQPFKTLRILHLTEWREVPSVDTSKLYAERLMIGLVRVANTLEAFQKIIITSSEKREKMQEYSRIQLDFDRIPDWIYSYEFKPHPEFSPLFVSLIETLERVHRPLRLEQCEEPLEDYPRSCEV